MWCEWREDTALGLQAENMCVGPGQEFRFYARCDVEIKSMVLF